MEVVSQTVGISVTTLERWRAEVLARPSGEEARHWTPAARLEAVIATAAMNEAARSAWCREHGVYPTELETWKQDAIGGLGEPRETESVAVEARASPDQGTRAGTASQGQGAGRNGRLACAVKKQARTGGPPVAVETGRAMLFPEGSGRTVFGGPVPGKKRGP